MLPDAAPAPGRHPGAADRVSTSAASASSSPPPPATRSGQSCATPSTCWPARPTATCSCSSSCGSTSSDSGQLRRDDGRWTVTGPLDRRRQPGGRARGRRRPSRAARRAGAPTARDGRRHRHDVRPDRCRRGRRVTGRRRCWRRSMSPCGRASSASTAPGTYRFAHELIRRSVYDGLGSAERRHLHLASPAPSMTDRRTAPVAEIAQHLVAAVPLVDAREPSSAALRAADAATEAVAYDDAARFLEMALAIAPDDRADLLLRVADATMRAGDVRTAKERCLEAFELARSEHRRRPRESPPRSPTRRRHGATHATVRPPPGCSASVLPLAADETTRVRLQASLTRALALAGDGDAARVLGEDALASARSIGRPLCPAAGVRRHVLRAVDAADASTASSPTCARRPRRHCRSATRVGEPRRLQDALRRDPRR